MENIKLSKRNFTVEEGYFYTIDESQDNLLQKTDDGTTAFSYPLDTLLTATIKSLEYDGVYFWSLEQGATTKDVVIRRWKIDNYVCKVQNSFSYTGDDVTHNYNSNAFSIEHYHTTLSGTTASGSSTIYLNKYWDHSSITSAVLHLGPNTDGEEEEVEVSSTVTGGVNLTSSTIYDYADGDPVNYNKNIWVFNNYYGTISVGSLYKFNSHTGALVTTYSGAAYSDIESATFYNVNSFTEYGDVDTLCYVKGTNLLFVNPIESGGTLSYYGSMVMDNVEDDDATVIMIYDLAMDDQNVYRLQLKATYYGSTETWSLYSYQLSTLDSFVASISLGAYPSIIAANEVSDTTIVATVKDQFLQPVSSRLVYFTEDEPSTGTFTGSNPDNTDADGKASTIFRSGDTACEVKITATVEQV